METEICNCGGEYCDGYKYWAPDPFQEEIWGDSSDYFECDEERYQSSMDI